MKPINVEITMGHNIGISASYYKPTEREVLEDYLKAILLLTVTTDKSKLEARVIDLTQRSKDTDYVIKAKLLEKDDEIQEMKREIILIKQEQRELLELMNPHKKLMNILEHE
jgi:hypothetical protein